MTSKRSWLSGTVDTTELCHGKDKEQSKSSLLLPQEGWLEGVSLEGKCPPGTSVSSVKRPQEEKPTQRYQPIVTVSSALTRLHMLQKFLMRQWGANVLLCSWKFARIQRTDTALHLQPLTLLLPRQARSTG